MSLNRKCVITGEEEPVRINFTDEGAEFEFHSKPYVSEAAKRKATPVFSGVLKYFPDAIAEVARTSFAGNEQHNPGTPLHWDRSKSGDELDALTRHLIDAGTFDSDGIRHSAKVAWRALANLQKEIENDRMMDWQEEVIARTEEDISAFLFDGDDCNGELGSHPLCSTDYCPCKEDEIEARMNVIGQNGNDGLHYETKTSISDYPESNMTSSIGDIEVEYNIITPGNPYNVVSTGKPLTDEV